MPRLASEGFRASDESLAIPSKPHATHEGAETLEMERTLAGCRARSLRQLAEWCRRELRDVARDRGLVVFEDSWGYFGHNAPPRLRVTCEARKR